MTKNRLLIIEDETSVAKQLKWGFQDIYEITFASEAEKARKLLASGAFPVVALDLGLPPFPDTPKEGFKLLEEIRRLSPKTKVIVITGNAEEEYAVKSIALGASDFCSKPVDLNLLKIILSRTFRLYELEEANQRLQKQIGQKGSFCGMLGVSPPMERVFERIRRASETDYPVLITGDSGTGKEMVACALHSLGSRAQKSFVIINCGAIPENLLESELFGHEKGAFTGAARRKIGRFEQADNGTVFLDEIGDLPIGLQVKILRFLQEGTIERIGGTRTINLNVRVIAATNINLEHAVREGNFREDLFYRLNVVQLRVPCLKERGEDLMLLAHHFLEEEAQKLQRGRVSFSPSAIACMNEYSWPGNVRELQNLIRRALGTSSGRVIDPSDLGFEEKPDRHKKKLITLKQAREKGEKEAIQMALAFTGNNISKAARLLEISRPTLHDLIKKHRVL